MMIMARNEDTNEGAFQLIWELLYPVTTIPGS